MKSTTITDLKASLSAYLNLVKAGGKVLVTEHEIPIAVIYPYSGEAQRSLTDYAALIRGGLVSPPQNSTHRDSFKVKPLDVGDAKDVITKSLMDEREHGW